VTKLYLADTLGIEQWGRSIMVFHTHVEIENNGSGISGTNGPFEQMLSDLYVFLIKESNIILNKMYSNTMIDRDALELEKYGKVNDEEESLPQLYNKLLLQANDNEANHHYKVLFIL
jgi:hypothetical protein